MCRDKADVNVSKGHYSEQNWLRFIGDFVPNVHVLRHSGYNLAHWNFSQRGLRRIDGVWFTNDGPLVLAHFSSLSSDTSWVSVNQNRERIDKDHPMYSLITEYKALLPGQFWHEWKGGWQETKF